MPSANISYWPRHKQIYNYAPISLTVTSRSEVPNWSTYDILHCERHQEIHKTQLRNTALLWSSIHSSVHKKIDTYTYKSLMKSTSQ